MSKKLFLILVGVILLIATGTRLIFITKHFAHVDDLLVASNALKHQLQSRSYYDFVSKINDKSNEGFYTSKYKLYRAIDSMGLLKKALQLHGFFIVTLNSTYAPLQFLITPLLISKGYQYTQFLFWGRLPSLILFMLSTLLMGYFLIRVYGKNKYFYEVFLIVLTLYSFSWMGIIYSWQMESYTIGLLVLWGLFFILWKVLSTDFDYRRAIVSGALLGVLFSAQYQIIIFFPAYFLTLFYYFYQKGVFKKVLPVLSVHLFSAAIFILPTWFLFFRHVSSRGINWNAGPLNEFVFQNMSLWEMPLFFIKNTFWVVFSNVSIFSSNFFWANVFLALMVSGLSVLGLISMINKKHTLDYYFGIFILLSLMIWTVLVIKNNFALSPTRHSLILLVIIIFLMMQGLVSFFVFLSQKSKKINISHAVLFVLGGFLIAYLIGLPFEFSKRKDPFDPQWLSQKLTAHKVQTVLSYDWTWNLFLMQNQLPKNIVLLFDDYVVSKNLTVNLNRVAFVSHRTPLTSSNFDRYVTKIAENYRVQNNGPYSGYHKIYEKILTSNVEIDFINLTKNGSNGFYFYIFEKI